MPPLWKIPRELWRIWQQVSFAFVHPFELLFFRLYLRAKPDAVRVQTGAEPWGADIAVFLLFQPGQLSGSTLQTCAHLQQKGYSVVVVSNSLVAQGDWAKMAPFVTQLIERPNFGYDFGGYRHGILALLSAGRQIENLLIMNDSVWFPVLDDSDLLDRMRTDPAPVTGPLMYHHRNPRHSHLQSYLINFNRDVVESDVFRTFWTTYSETNYKVQTIRRGEMGLSATLRDAGFQLCEIFEHEQARDASDALSDTDLRRVLAYEARRNTQLAGEIHGILEIKSDDPCWRARAVSLMQHPKRRQYFLTNHPALNIAAFRFPILKKDRGFEYRLQRKELLSMVEAGTLPAINPVVFQEIAKMD